MAEVSESICPKTTERSSCASTALPPASSVSRAFVPSSARAIMRLTTSLELVFVQ